MSTYKQRVWALIMKEVNFPEKCIDEECPHLRGTPDAFGTGDPPISYECEACCLSDCMFHEEVADQLKRYKHEKSTHLGTPAAAD